MASDDGRLGHEGEPLWCGFSKECSITHGGALIHGPPTPAPRAPIPQSCFRSGGDHRPRAEIIELRECWAVEDYAAGNIHKYDALFALLSSRWPAALVSSCSPWCRGSLVVLDRSPLLFLLMNSDAIHPG